MIVVTIFSFGQDDLRSEIFSSDVEPTEHYDWVKNFNEKNMRNRVINKNDKTHQLDSSISYLAYYEGGFAGSIDFSKALYFYEDSRDIRYTYSRENFVWEANKCFIEYYDNENLLISSSFNSWDGDLTSFNDNDPLVLRSYFYDENNLLVEEHAQIQSEVRNKILGNVYNYHYHDDGLLESVDYHSWSAQRDSLVLRGSICYKHDIMRNLVLTLQYENDNDRGYFATDSILRIISNEGLLDKVVRYKKGDITNDWLLKSESSYNYDNDGRAQKILNRGYYRNNWEPGDTFFLRYHPYGSLDESSLVETDSSSFEQIGILFEDIRFMSNYKHDSNITINQIKLPRSYSPHYEQHHMLIERNDFENIQPGGSQYGWGDMAKTSSAEYFYSEITTSTDNVETNQLSIISLSPNPAREYIEIISAEPIGELQFTMTDISGRRVLDQQIYTNQRINITHISKGTYIYTVNDGNGQSTGKVIVH